jgi:hypothetical protein
LKEATKRFIIFGILFMLLTMSIATIQANENKKNLLPKKALADNENILANISVTWFSFFYNFSVDDLQPKISVNQSTVTDFYFPEINGSIQMNFTVVCRHKLVNKVIIPRFTRVYLAVIYNGSYLFWAESVNHRCKNLWWEYINFTVDPNSQLIPLNTTGNNATLDVEVGIYGFPFGMKGNTLALNPITVHPIVVPPK